MSASYTRVARLAFPFVAAALALFVFLQIRQPICPEPAPAPEPRSSPGLDKAFSSIYRNKTWGTNGKTGTSGSGSTLHATLIYRTFLQQFMADQKIHSVVDAGCGDWGFSHAIDWTGIDYKGYDIVASVVAADTATYGKPNIRFFTANIVDTDLPPADLLIIKDVLQHLPIADVQKVVAQFPKYKHILVTEGVGPDLSARNADLRVEDIEKGAYANRDLTRPPFNLPGEKLLTWWSNHGQHQVIHLTTDQSYVPD